MPDKVIGDIRAAYSTAAKMAIYEGTLSWRTTAVFTPYAIALIGGSVFPSFTGSSDPKVLAITSMILSIIGFIASIMWWSMVSRSRKYYAYWLYTVRELESHMCETVKTFSDGYTLASGDSVTRCGEALNFKSIQRIKMQTNLNLFYGTFILIFSYLLIQNLIQIIEVF